MIAVVGPTATGKSDLGLDLAEEYDGVIINADAMALYRGMDIGTAKIPPAQRRGIEHYQLDVLDITEEASVAAYQRRARADIDEARERGKRAVLVGGSGLYVRAVLENFEFPPTDPEVRARVAARGEEVGPGVLHDELAAKDPAAAAQIARANLRRIVRALEVIELTGEPFSASLPDPSYLYPTVAIGLDSDLETLDRRIASRTEDMFERGLVEETEALLARGLAEGTTASRAVGYSQAIDVIRGRASTADATGQVALATRQLARRQRKWFQRDRRITWTEAGTRIGQE